MREFFEKLQTVLKNGEDAVLVTIIAASGSTPRGAGARMLVTAEGRLCGTIGGGNVEYKSEQIALDVIRDQKSAREYFRLHPNQIADIGMICGGNVDVFFHYIPKGDEYTVMLVKKIIEYFDHDESFWLITETTGALPHGISVFSPKYGVYGQEIPKDIIFKLDSKPISIKSSDAVFYVEQLVQSGKVYIFGGGHVSQQLVPTLARVGFKCVVVEDRADFIKPELFENKAFDIKLVEMEHLDKIACEITENDFICVMTRGHKDDYTVQYHMLKTPARYIGVIGSKRKIAGVSQRLKDDGYTDEDIARITAPIGLEIGSETPAEIAVSIAAQLISVRAEKK